MHGVAAPLRVALELTVLASAVAAGCGRPAGPPVGVSTPRGEPGAPRAADAGARADAASPVPADFREHMTRVVERATSLGHGQAFEAVVWADDAARAAWAAGGEMPEGATLVEEAIAPDARGDRAAGLLVMEKRGGAWRFTVVDAGGHVEDARTAACAECHREAPRDGVFRAAAPPPAPR